jgi:chromosome segregation ATPase
MIKQYCSLIKEYFNLIAKKKKLEEFVKDLEWKEEVCKARLMSTDELGERLEKAREENKPLKNKVESLEKSLEETQKELEEYKDKYALLKAAVLGIDGPLI